MVPASVRLKGETQVLQFVHGFDRFAAHHLHRVLVAQVVAALHGIEGVPLPVVFLHVAQGGADASCAAPVCERVG